MMQSGMLDKFNRNLNSGMTIFDEIGDAGKSRFRAISLTTITTFVGLSTLIWKRAFKLNFLQFWQYQLHLEYYLVLLFYCFNFPSLILFFNDLKRTRLWFWRGGKNPLVELM